MKRSQPALCTLAHGLALLATLLSPAALYPQAADANLVGTVADSSNAAIPRVELELTNSETGTHYTSSSDDHGQYRFNNVPVGRYDLRATAGGFAGTTIQNLELALNRNQTVNITMQVASLATTMEVVDAIAAIDTTTATVQTTYNTKQVVQMPLTGTGTLGVINLSLLSAGVASNGGVGYGTGPSVGGQRPTNNNFTIEGVDNNNRSVTGPIISVSNEQVAEFSLQQNQFSAEFGHSTGGQFNSVVKSGTNELHGSLYEYNQNKLLAATDESFKRQGIRSAPRFDQNRLGATIGGPVIKNKLFYFGGFEYLPIGLAATSSASVFGPTAEGFERLGQIPGINQQNLDQFRKYVPVPGSQTSSRPPLTIAGVEIPVGVLNLQGQAYQNDYRPAVSIDYNISDRDQLRLRWLHYRSDQVDTTANLPSFYTLVQIRNHVASAAYFHSLAPNITNELRLGYNRRTDERPIENYSFPGLDAFPNLQFRDLRLTIGPNSNYPQGNRSNTYQFADNLNWILGRHNLKFGYDGRKLNISNFFVQRVRGEYIYQTFERYLRDITPEFAERSVGGFPFIGNLVSHYGFANDEFRLRPNFTLTLGLRYEFVDVPTGAKQQDLNAISSVPGLVDFRAPKPGKLDFAPRISIAWSPGVSGRTSIRAGFGMAYDQIYQNLGTNSLPPQYFTTIDAHVDSPGQPNFLADGGIPGTAPAGALTQAQARALTASYIPDQQRPYAVSWNFGIQQVLRQDYTLEVRYLGTRGVHLPMQVNINRIAAVTPGRSLPIFLERPSQAALDALALTLPDITTGFNSNIWAPQGFRNTVTAFTAQGNSSYHGLATQLTRRYSSGLQTTIAYTWSHNIDDSTAALNSTALTPRRPQDFQNLGYERASSALDRRHRFTAGWLYDVPWLKNNRSWMLRNGLGNWTFSGTYIFETGAWATPQSGIDANLNGDPAADRTVINALGDGKRSSAVTALRNSRNQIVGYLANDPTARYIAAGQGVFPNGGRNTLRLPDINNFDLALSKRIAFTERVFLELRGEAYNALNKAQYTAGYPSVANLRTRTSAASLAMLTAGDPTFARPDLAFQSNARGLQVVARIQF